MLARMRPFFLLSCSLVLAAFLPVQAQIHGTPPSVTSFGFGGSNNPAPGVPASVTSLGPNGYGNGFNGFGNGFNGFGNGFNGFGNGFNGFGNGFNGFGNGFNGLNGFGERFPRRAEDGWRKTDRSSNRGERRVRDHQRFPDGESSPAYVPYAVPYPVPYPVADADSGDGGPADDPNYSRGGPPAYDRGPGHRDGDASRPTSHEPAPRATAATDPDDPPDPPVASQPDTVLIFKDGHKSEVQNYAIVGGTLFDYSDGRSHKILLADLDLPATLKANDDRGVDFQIPAKAKQVSKKN